MATETERLVVQLEARLTQYERDLKKAGAQTDRETRKIERRFDQMSGGIGSRLRSIAGALGVALSGAVFIGLVRDAARLADELGDVAQQLGITTSELQALKFAALETGLSNERLDTALDTLTRKLGDAATGSSEAQAQFRALGVAVFDAQGRARPFNVILEEVARKIGGLTNPTEQSAAAIDFFGKTGARLVPFLNEVSGGLDELTQRASDAGRVMSEETVAALGDANKELERFRDWLRVASAEAVIFGAAMARSIPEAVAALGQGKVAEAAANELEALQKRLKFVDESLAAFGVGQGADEDIGVTMGALATVNALLEERLQIMRRLSAVNPVADGAPPEKPTKPVTLDPYTIPPGGVAPKVDSFQAAIAATQERTRALAAQTEALKLNAIEGERLIQQQALQAAAAKAQLPLDEDRLALIYETADALAQQAAQLEFARGFEAVEERIQRLREEADLIGRTAEETQRLKTETELLNLARAQGIEITDALRLQIAAIADEEARLGEAIRAANAELEAQQALAQDIEGALTQAFDRVGAAITEAFAKGEISAIDFGQIGQAIIADLISSLVRLAVQAAASFIGNALMPGGGAGGGGGFLHFGGPRAKGGPVQAGKVYMVGEKGPEPFIPSRGGTIVPNGALAQQPVIKVAPLIQVAPTPGAVQVNVINRASGTEARQEQRSDGQGGTVIDVMIDRIVADKLGRPGTASNRALGQLGFKPRLTRR